MSKQRHRRRSQGGTSPETTPQTGSGVAHFSVSEVVQFSMSVDKKYKSDNRCYPERICADRIYINTKNRRFCTRVGIRLSGKRLGRPPKDQKRNAEHKQQLLADQRKRNEVEGVFGTGKRIYSLNLIMPKLKAGAEGTISMSFLVMCAEKILKLLRLFFVLLFVCLWSLLTPHETARRARRASGIRWTDLQAVV